MNTYFLMLQGGQTSLTIEAWDMGHLEPDGACCPVRNVLWLKTLQRGTYPVAR